MNFNYYIESQIPFVEKGRDESGLDCWGLVKLFYKYEFDIDLLDYTECYKDTKDTKIAETIDIEKNEWYKVSTPRNGDVILCRIVGRPMHVGIYKEHDKMLHIETGSDVCIETIGNSKWNKRILGIYRHKDLM